MSLNLEAKSNDKDVGREVVEAQNILNDLFEHHDGYGSTSTITLGMPGSCKSTINLIMCNYVLKHYPNDKVFWRSALNAPLQFFKLDTWQIYVERGSDVNFIDRITRRNITDELNVIYFDTFEELYNICKPGICNALFFKDSKMDGIENDNGTLQWFNWINFLLGFYEWKYVFLDEYHEMIKAGASGLIWHKIQNHSDDVSNARKSNLGIHGNAHQMSELDSRVVQNIMCMIQAYGSKLSKHSPVNKKALHGLVKPNQNDGAYAWISIAGTFGKFRIAEVIEMPKNLSIMAKIVKSDDNI